MADVLNIGTSALLSLQRAISTTGQNIANVNTEGFSRQRVEFAALEPQLSGSGFVGSGVGIAAITRSYDQYLAGDVLDRTSSAAGASALGDLSGRVDDILADPATGLGPVLDEFFGAVQDVANNPGSLPERQVLLGQAEVLADRFQYLNDRFAGLDQEANIRIDNSVREINAFAAGIADLNDRIVSETVRSGGQPPNDLLDARDQLLNRLSEVIGVTTVDQGDGAVNVLVGNGQALVVGSSVTELETFTDPFDVTRVNVGISGLAVQTDIGRFLSGGELGAVLDFRGNVLDGARSDLGLIATGLTATFNDQQALGLDLNGNFGGDFFRPLEPTISESISNTGTGAVTAVITDPTNLSGDEYQLSFDGANYTLTNTTTNASTTGPGPAFSIDGIDITVSGTPAAGDDFLIAPVAQGASLFDVAISDPRAFAAASPLRSSTSLANAGSGQLNDLAVSDVASLPLAGNIVLTFNSDALGAGVPGFDVTGIAGGPIAYDPSTDANGLPVTLGDIEFTLQGIPEDGDSFSIANNVDGSGDNRNALALAALQTERTLNGGTASYQDAYASLLADVAVSTRQAKSAADTEGTLLEQARSALNSAQGVNLDEEAANLIRYQQAYQAAAQVIAVADEVFQTLLNATRRR
ncbi:flagellar hook-associated protein FlgK [Congregibacter litoralis]|uniref:Flagellar hook-associated protein 1 n=1 Tax=Congregibacter litoralis KT71 TaxID=314285 RepID=A4A609_9GAMM|nr:flagellar hook-associated protein FlgK [Congregibacter litoralis]EAQ98456.2 flagellar hook-associated protein FlgK [Congregibacter litoralis KT71]